MEVLKTVELADFAEKMPKEYGKNGRVGRLRREKCHKNGNGNPEKREFECCCSTASELKPLQYKVLLLCQSREKRICKVTFFFECF